MPTAAPEKVTKPIIKILNSTHLGSQSFNFMTLLHCVKLDTVYHNSQLLNFFQENYSGQFLLKLSSVFLHILGEHKSACYCEQIYAYRQGHGMVSLVAVLANH